MISMILPFMLCFACIGWVLTHPKNGKTATVKNIPAELHRKKFLESRGWTAREIAADGSTPVEPVDPTVTLEQGDGFTVTVTGKEDGRIKSVAFGDDETVAFGKLKKDQLITVCKLAELEHKEDDTVEALKIILGDWANEKFP